MQPILFMGTPAFAVPSLRRLAAAGYPLTVLTQPDRPAGRSGAPQPSPVKQAATELGLPVLQPPTLRDPAAVEQIRQENPAAIVVVAYGEILRRTVLEIPPYSCLNLHPSLLPRWRGPTPINAAILEGDATTGVSVIRMDAGMDSGPLLAQELAPVAPDDTAATLGARLAKQGADLLAETLACVLRGEARAQPQPTEGVTVCRLLSKEDGRMEWTRPAAALERQVRAYDPWPGTFTAWVGRRLKILAVALLPDAGGCGEPGRVRLVAELLPNAEGGERRLAVCCGEGWLELRQVQLEGKPAVLATGFLHGYPAFASAVLE
ncbi:MAG: methionyl-tRNA formyltransferase [Chloroflexia bacterium]